MVLIVVYFKSNEEE